MQLWLSLDPEPGTDAPPPDVCPHAGSDGFEPAFASPERDADARPSPARLKLAAGFQPRTLLEEAA